MFIEKKEVVSVNNDMLNNSYKTTRYLYLFEGQTPNTKNTHPEVQKYYKKLFMKQEEETIKKGRPICILEILNPID